MSAMVQMDPSSSREESSGSEIDSYDESSEEECGILGSPFPGVLNVQMKAKTMPGGAFRSSTIQSPVSSDVLDTSCNDLEAPTPERTLQTDNHSFIQTQVFSARDLSKFVKIENALNPIPIQVKRENALNVAVKTGSGVHENGTNIDCSPISYSDISDANINASLSESKSYSNLYDSDDFFNGEQDWSPSSSDQESAPETIPIKRPPSFKTRDGVFEHRSGLARDASDSDSNSNSDDMSSPRKRRKRAHFLSSSSESSWREEDDEKQEFISKGICPYCEKQFSRQSALKGHMLLCNSSLKDPRGSSEGLSSTNNTPVKRHRRAKRRKLKSKPHDREEILEANVKVVKPTQCSLCAARFKSYSNLMMHMRNHASEVSLTGKRSTRSEKPEYFQCSTIKQENEDMNYIQLFRELKSLGDTSWSVDPNNTKTMGQNSDSENHNCLYCSKSFFRKAALESHMKMHSIDGGPPIASPRTRARSFALNRRMSLNGSDGEGLKVYTCEVCSDCFPRRAAYIAHMKDHALRQLIDSPKLSSILRRNCSFTMDEISSKMNGAELDINGNQNSDEKSDLEQTDFKNDIFKKKNCRILVPRIKME